MITPRRMSRQFIVAIVLGVTMGLVLALLLTRAFSNADSPFSGASDEPGQVSRKATP